MAIKNEPTNHLIQCIEDSSNYFLEHAKKAVTIRKVNPPYYYFTYYYSNKTEYARAIANCVRWMLDEEFPNKNT